MTIYDYDDPSASGDNPAAYNESPTNLPYRKIEKGYRKTSAGDIATYEYITVLTYNDRGQVESIDGPRSGTADTTSFAYDATTKDLTSVTRPLVGATVFSEFDAAGNPRRLTDVNGQVRTFVLDERGRIKEVHNGADGSMRQVAYNLAGLPALHKDEDLVSRTFQYDPYGQIRRTIDHEGNYRDTILNVRGNFTELKHWTAAGDLTLQKWWEYNGSDYPGLLFKEINADLTFTRYQYDASGNVTTRVDPNGNQTDYAYDAFNRVTSITQSGSVVTRLTYDTQGNLTKVIDPEGDPGNAALGHTTTYTYDDMGNVIGVSSPDSGTTAYGFRPEGDIMWMQDANGIQVYYSNDALYRRTAAAYPAAGDLPAYTVGYAYDLRANGKGHLTNIAEPSGRTLLDYDTRGRLKEMKSTVSGIQFILSRQFTDAGRVSRLTYPDGRTVSYDRGACKCRIVGVKTRGAGETTDTVLLANLDYQPFGPTSGMDVGNGGKVGNLYDLNGRLHIANLGKSDEVTFNYYPNGQLHTITAPNVPFFNRTFTYDDFNRLETSTGPDGDQTYSYDKAGNRLVKVGYSEQDCAYTPGTNRLVWDGDSQRAYDSAGNTTIMFWNYPFQYDQENRLVSVCSGYVATHAYNGLGQRVVKTTPDEGTVLFLYDFHGNIVAEADGNGSIQKEYIYRGSSRLAMVDKTQATQKIYFFHNNRLGAPEMMTDSTNTVVWEASYDAFGGARVDRSSTVENNFRLPGQYFDAETGLHYNNHRYYDPTTGRYLTPDPIGLAGGINPYVYTDNDPVNRVDLLGLAPPAEVARIVVPALPVIAPLVFSTAAAAIGVFGLTTVIVLYPPTSIAEEPAVPIAEETESDECDNKGKWICRATCHETPIGLVSGSQRIISAMGSGSTKSIACQNAIKACQGLAARGTYTRHCQCPTCWRR